VAFARVAQGDDHAPAHQPEIAGVDRDRHIGQATDRAIEDARGQNLERALAGPLAARRVDDVVALAKLGQEGADQFGRVLKVAVHQHDGVAASGVEPGGRRDLVAEIARQRDYPQVPVGGRGRQELRQRVVPAAVVDADQLPGRGR